MHGRVKSRAEHSDNELSHLARETGSSARGRTAVAATAVGAERSEQAAVAHALARLLPALAGLDLPCFLHLLGHRRALATVMRLLLSAALSCCRVPPKHGCHWAKLCMSGCMCAHTGILGF